MDNIKIEMLKDLNGTHNIVIKCNIVSMILAVLSILFALTGAILGIINNENLFISGLIVGIVCTIMPKHIIWLSIDIKNAKQMIKHNLIEIHNERIKNEDK